MADELSPTGKWIDFKTGRVVDSPPVEGRLLVAPGGPLTPDVIEAIGQAEAAQPAASVEPAPAEPEAEPEPEPEPAHHAAKASHRSR